MTNFTRLTLPAFAFALASTALFVGGIAHADNAMKPANAMKTDAMKPADSMKAKKMKKDCMDKAAMEKDSMKMKKTNKACDDMGTKAMKSTN